MFRIVRMFLRTICLELGILLILYTCITNRRLSDVDNFDARPYQDASTYTHSHERTFTPYQDGEYSVISDLVTPPGETMVSVNKTHITICSQTSLGNLFRIEPLARAWSGPISVAVLTYDDRVDVTLDYILLLRRCSPEVRRRTSFHLVAPSGRVPETLNFKVEQIADCGLLEYWIRTFAEENYALEGVAYPVNVLRNVALKNARTSYVMNLDIDLVPSYGMHEEIVTFLLRLDEQEKLRKTLYVVPGFESKPSNGIMTKGELIEAYNQGTVRPFSVGQCRPCTANTDHKRWLTLPYPSEMSVAYLVKYNDPYEPYYIALKTALPYFDERFKQYGFNRLSQICEAYVAGFDFAVLNNAFVTHDGFRGQVPKAKNETSLAHGKFFRNVFIPELKSKYPESTRTCLRRIVNS